MTQCESCFGWFPLSGTPKRDWIKGHFLCSTRNPVALRSTSTVPVASMTLLWHQLNYSACCWHASGGINSFLYSDWASSTGRQKLDTKHLTMSTTLLVVLPAVLCGPTGSREIKTHDPNFLFRVQSHLYHFYPAQVPVTFTKVVKINNIDNTFPKIVIAQGTSCPPASFLGYRDSHP